MNTQQAVQPRSSSNGFGRRKVDKDTANRFDNRFPIGKTNASKTSFVKGGMPESLSCDRLVYLTTTLIGHQVEVQVQDGSVFSGIFHTTNAEDSGIVLKMAHLIKDGTRGQNSSSDFPSKPPAKTLIITAKDLVQVIAKGVPVTRDGLINELQHEKQQELMTDSYISQSRHVNAGRELERWVPDDNDPTCPELENIFDGAWNRGWDQFEVNATLFGVKSTFNEELYTTKLEKGSRELEREAARIAREIEGEGTLDRHLAEERGKLDENLEVDEETRFSSVCRGVDDSGYDEIEDILLDSQNDETFGGVSDSVIGKSPVDRTDEKMLDRTQVSSGSSSMGEVKSSLTSMTTNHLVAENDSRQLLAEQSPVISDNRVHDNQFRGLVDSSCSKEEKEKHVVLDQGQVSKAEPLDPPNTHSKGHEKARTSNDLSEAAIPSKTQGTTNSLARPSSSASSTSDRGGVTSTSAVSGLTSSSSVSSLSSEKSTLNPNAKEFKLNPNAKSFVPTQSPLRPSSPVAESPFYYPPNMAVPQMPGMPMGMGHSFAGQQPVIFNPQGPPMQQPYYHPTGPQYGQHMMMGQPRPFLYMPSYPPEMQYKGREF